MCGCLGSVEIEPNVLWSGVLLDAGVTGKSTWIKFNGEYGTMSGITTKVWSFRYPIVDSLIINQSYSFYSYTTLTSQNNIVTPLQLLRIEDNLGGIVWKQ